MGALAGVAAAGFVRGMHIVEDLLRPDPLALCRATWSGMLLVGVLMYALFRTLGQYYVDGVGYSDDREHSRRRHVDGLAAGPVVRLQDAGDFDQPRFGVVRRNFLALLVHGRNAGRRIRRAAGRCGPAAIPSSIPAFAMVGMGAMVGGGTGAVMTAVTMIFEMTRDYDIVMPMILAVATSVGVRRLLSRENIYTLKLVRRGRYVPKALHANMFLVRHAQRGHGLGRAGPAGRDSFDAFLREHERRRPVAPCRRDARTADSTASFASIPVCGAGLRAPIPA